MINLNTFRLINSSLCPPSTWRSMLASVCRLSLRCVCDKAEWAPCIKSSTSLLCSGTSLWCWGPAEQVGNLLCSCQSHRWGCRLAGFTQLSRLSLCRLLMCALCALWQVGNWTTRQLSGFVEFTLSLSLSLLLTIRCQVKRTTDVPKLHIAHCISWTLFIVLLAFFFFLKGSCSWKRRLLLLKR